jgi:hypothetical protein
MKHFLIGFKTYEGDGNVVIQSTYFPSVWKIRDEVEKRYNVRIDNKFDISITFVYEFKSHMDWRNFISGDFDDKLNENKNEY